MKFAIFMICSFFVLWPKSQAQGHFQGRVDEVISGNHFVLITNEGTRHELMLHALDVPQEGTRCPLYDGSGTWDCAGASRQMLNSILRMGRNDLVMCTRIFDHSASEEQITTVDCIVDVPESIDERGRTYPAIRRNVSMFMLRGWSCNNDARMARQNSCIRCGRNGLPKYHGPWCEGSFLPSSIHIQRLT